MRDRILWESSQQNTISLGISMVKSASTERLRTESPWMLLWLSIGVIVLGAVSWGVTVWVYPHEGSRASFGTAVGGVNTLFAGLGFAAIAYTLILQARALTAQRRELEAQRADLEGQVKRAERQTLEAMLVQLLTFHHAIASNVSTDVNGQKHKGRDALRWLADKLRATIRQRSLQDSAEAIVVAQQGYETFHEQTRGELDHYFRNLYHIIKFIDQSGVQHPRRYTSLVRAQLSPPELALLFYNGLSERAEKFNPLIVRYALLEQLPDNELATIGHKSLYPALAYSDSRAGDVLPGAAVVAEG